MSHELRTPLNAIIGFTEMLVSNAARFGTEKALEPLRRVNRAGTHLLGLINQVLDLSKIEAGKLELNLENVSIAPLIEEVVGTARPLAEQNKNRLSVECSRDLPPIEADAMRLRQILLNLLSNACKFTKDGEICLRATPIQHDGAAVHRVLGDRYRHRHDARPDDAAVRGVFPGRCIDRAALRRYRPRLSDHTPALPDDGRRRDGGQRTRQRLDIYGPLAIRSEPHC